MDERIIITSASPKSPVSEAYRTLRTNIQFSNIDKDVKSIVVTSPGPSAGKSTVAVNLAVTMAQVDQKVLLIDCDLRKPRCHNYFGVTNNSGLTKVLFCDIDYREVIYSIGIGQLDILTSGPIPPNPAELLGSNKIKLFLEKVEEDYDMVILDSPPVGMVTDAAVLSTITDGTILVCAVGQSYIDGAKNARALLDKVNANILGVVLNKVPVKESGYYKYHYYQYYNSYYDDVNEKKSKKKKKRKKEASAS